MAKAFETEQVLELSASAVEKIHELIQSRGRPNLAVRVAVRGVLPGGGYQTEFKFVGQDERRESDIVQDAGKFLLFFDPGCAASIGGATVDFDEQRYASGFHIEYQRPAVAFPEGVEPKRDWDDPVAQSIQRVLDEQINPAVASHGGWVLLLDHKDGVAYVEMGGGCQGCGLAAVTLQQGVETAILDQVPEVSAVIDKTEHAGGSNPYYAPSKGGDSNAESPFE